MFCILAGSCVNVNRIDVNSIRIGNIVPHGFRSLDGTFYAEISNSACEFSVYDVNGCIRRGDSELGRFTLDPVTISGRSSGEVEIGWHISAGSSFSVMDLMTMMGSFNLSDFRMDIYFTVRPRGGIAKKMKFKDIPAERIFDLAKRK